VAKFEVEAFEKAFVSVKKTSTSLLFAVDKKFHFATSLKFLSPSSHLQSGALTTPCLFLRESPSAWALHLDRHD
jgi:hypothetical protein